MKNCKNCKYADWQRTDAGKLHPSGAGRCSFVYKVAPLPASMYFLTAPRPLGGNINRREELNDHCTYFLREGA